MGNTWYCIPSKRPPEQAEPVLKKWADRGYHVAVQLDFTERTLDASFSLPHRNHCHLIECRPYSGYAEAVNHLCRKVLSVDPDAEWIVTGGDDVLPDPNHTPEQIARECSEHFECCKLSHCAKRTFGVMQPTGDREFGDAQGPYIDRVAGSPWLGREFCRRMYGGRGPLCEEYFHMGEDEELQAVATMLGVFWQRPDLIHRHEHWGRPRAGEKMGLASRMPEFLQRANSPEEWRRFKRVFAARKDFGFPGHEPIP